MLTVIPYILDILKYKKTVDNVMNDQLKKTISIKIKRLDMFPNHFFGITEINGEDYCIGKRKIFQT